MTHQFILAEELNPIENILKAIIYSVNTLYNFIDKIMGLLGIVILMPFFALVTFSLWAILKFSNWRLITLTKSIFNKIDQEEPRKIMLFHYAIRNRRIETDHAILKLKPSSDFFLFKPLFGQVKYSRRIFLEIEQRLHKTAYPHLHQSLTTQQRELVTQLSKNMDGIWEDSDFVTIK